MPKRLVPATRVFGGGGRGEPHRHRFAREEVTLLGTVTNGKDAVHARSHVVVDPDRAVLGQPQATAHCQVDRRSGSDAHEHCVRRKPLAAIEHDGPHAAVAFDGRHADTGVHHDALRLESLADVLTEFVIECGRQEVGHQLDEVHLEVFHVAEFVGELCSDESAADDDHVTGLVERFAEGDGVLHALADRVHAFPFDSGDRWQHGIGPGRQHELVERVGLAAGGREHPRLGVQADDFVDDDVDPGFLERQVAHDVLGGVVHGVNHVGDRARDHPVADLLDEAPDLSGYTLLAVTAVIRPAGPPPTTITSLFMSRSFPGALTGSPARSSRNSGGHETA